MPRSGEAPHFLQTAGKALSLFSPLWHLPNYYLIYLFYSLSDSVNYSKEIFHLLCFLLEPQCLE